MYYLMTANPFFDRGVLDDPSLPDGVSLTDGASVDWVPDGPLVFRTNCDAGNPPRDYMGGALPAWSGALLSAFTMTGVDNVQAFPAVLADVDGVVRWDGYFAVNVVGLLAAADLSASRFMKIGESPGGLPFLGFEKLVIDPKKTLDLSLFRLAENPLKLIVHDRVVGALSSRPAPPGGWGVTLDRLDESAGRTVPRADGG